MARVKGRVPVTFALPPEVLAMVDGHAQTVGLDRYDVMRMAIAKGMVVMRFEHELLMDQDGTYRRAMFKAMVGDESEEDVQMLEAGLVKGFERDIPGGPSKLKRRRKVKDDGL